MRFSYFWEVNCITQDLHKKFIFKYFSVEENVASLMTNISVSFELMVHPLEICLCQWNLISAGSLIKECHFAVFCMENPLPIRLTFAFSELFVWSQSGDQQVNSGMDSSADYQCPKVCALLGNEE